MTKEQNATNRVRMPVAGHPPHTTESLHHHLLHAGRLGKIIFGDQQVALLSDTWRVAKRRSDHMQRELALQLCLSAGPHRMEQSWPARDAGAAQESCHLGA